MKQLVLKSVEHGVSYTSTIGVRNFDEMIVISQKIKESDVISDCKIIITKQEFDEIIKFIKGKFKGDLK